MSQNMTSKPPAKCLELRTVDKLRNLSAKACTNALEHLDIDFYDYRTDGLSLLSVFKLIGAANTRLTSMHFVHRLTRDVDAFWEEALGIVTRASSVKRLTIAASHYHDVHDPLFSALMEALSRRPPLVMLQTINVRAQLIDKLIASPHCPATLFMWGVSRCCDDESLIRAVKQNWSLIECTFDGNDAVTERLAHYLQRNIQWPRHRRIICDLVIPLISLRLGAWVTLWVVNSVFDCDRVLLSWFGGYYQSCDLRKLRLIEGIIASYEKIMAVRSSDTKKSEPD